MTATIEGPLISVAQRVYTGMSPFGKASARKGSTSGVPGAAASDRAWVCGTTAATVHLGTQ